MTPELQKKLFDKYPKIFRQKDLPMQVTCMCWGIECGDGWYRILDMLCGFIQSHVDHYICYDQDGEHRCPQVEAVQVKEKYGSMRVYLNAEDDIISGAIGLAARLSVNTCEDCGKDGTMCLRGAWWRALCPECAKNQGFEPLKEEE